jgi:hypothetical protein
VPLFWQRSQALGQQPQSLGFDRQLLGLRAKEAAPDSDNITYIRTEAKHNLIPEPVLSRIDLESSPPILDVKKRGLPHLAHSHDPARHLELGGQVRQLLVAQIAAASENISGRMTWSKIVGIRRMARLFEFGGFCRRTSTCSRVFPANYFLRRTSLLSIDPTAQTYKLRFLQMAWGIGC